jgi:hypothetical protein
MWRTIIITVCILSIAATGFYLSRPVHHKYSDIPGQDHPYCPPDPKECGD